MANVVLQLILFILRFCKANISAEFAKARQLDLTITFAGMTILKAVGVISQVRRDVPNSSQWLTYFRIIECPLKCLLRHSSQIVERGVTNHLNVIGEFASAHVHELKLELYSRPYRALLNVMRVAPSTPSLASVLTSGDYYYIQGKQPLVLASLTATLPKVIRRLTVDLTQANASHCRIPIHPWTMLVYVPGKRVLVNIDAHSEAEHSRIVLTELGESASIVRKSYAVASMLNVVPYVNFATFRGRCDVLDIEDVPLPNKMEIWRAFNNGADGFSSKKG